MKTPGVPPSFSVPSTDTDGAYSVSWGTSSGSVSSYQLQEQTNGGNFATIQNTTATSRSISGKANGTYGYRVRACNSLSCSSWTTTKSVQVLKTPGVPPSFSVPSTDTDGAYSVSWGTSSGSVSSYQLQEQTNGGTFATIQNTTATSRSISGKADGTYGYRVRACNSLSCSEWTATQTVQVAFPLGTPGSISTPATSVDGSYTVSWGAASGSVSTYKLEQSVDGGNNWVVLQNNGNLSYGPTNNSVGRYEYQVSACNSLGACSDPTGTATTDVAPAPPASLSSDEGTFIYGEGKLTLSWPASTGAQTYNVERQVPPDTWQPLATTQNTSLTLNDNPGGSNSYRVKACFETACSAFSPQLDVLIVVLPQLADPVPIAAADAAGSMAYRTQVTRAGNAAVHIPISEVAGVNGLAPNLTLVYSSGGARDMLDARRESGLLGYGWSLEGLSGIRRCRIGTSGDVNMTTTDRLCLDREPLMLVSGTSYWAANAEYRTERQSMIRVLKRETNGHVWFEAFLPNGGRMVYGDTIEATATAFTANSPYLWSVRLIEDVFGNQLTVNYFHDVFKGTNYPLHMDYEGARIDFYYQMRSDTTAVTYGSNDFFALNATRTVALNRVEISMAGIPVREYRIDNQLDLDEDYLRVEQVQLCGYDSAGASLDCLAPLTFAWTTDAQAPAEFVSAVTAVTDGVGARTELDYALLPASGTHALNYSEAPFGTPPSEPTAQPLTSGTARRVVSEYRLPNGVGGHERTTYGYKGPPLYNTQNRGFAGFAERRVNRLSVPDYDTGAGTTTNRTISTFEQYELAHPFIGRVSHRIQVLDGVVGNANYLLNEIENLWLATDLGNGVSFPHLSARISRALEDGASVSANIMEQSICFRALSSGICPGTGTQLEFPTQRTTTRSVGTDISSGTLTSIDSTESRVTNFENDISQGVIGFPSQRVTTLDTPSAPAVSRSQQFTRVAGTNAVASATRFPNNTDLELQTTLAYDALGNVTQVSVSGQDVANRTTQIGSFDDGRYPQSITDAGLNHTSVIYDHRFGAVNAITDADQNSQLFIYDHFGRALATEGPDGTTVSQWVDACGGGLCNQVTWANAVLRVAVTTNNGATQVAPTERIYLDALGRTVLRETEAFDGGDGWVREEIHYDSAGRVTKTSLPYFSNGGTPAYIIQRQDVLGRTVAVERPDGGQTQTSFTGSAGTLTVDVTETVVTPGTANVTRQKRATFDARGLLASTTDALGTGNAITTSYGYDSGANLANVTVDGTQLAAMSYNAAGMRTQINEVNTGITEFDVDALGRIRSQTDARGDTSTFAYDDLDRLTRRTDGTGTAGAVTRTWSWDPTNGVGQLAARSQGNFTETLTYDGAGRVSQVSTAVNVTGFPGNGSYAVDLAYDSAGRLASTSWPSGATFTNVYNTRGYRTRVKQGSTVLETTAARDAFGNPVRAEFGNGLATDRNHDVLGRITRIKTGPSSTPASLQDLEYQWRSNGSLYQRLDKRGSTSTGDDWVETFNYDPLDRLTAATTVKSGSTARILNFSYDRRGNLTSKTSSVTGDLDVTGYQYSGPHRLTSAVIGGISHTFSYDAAGNITAYNASSGDDTQIDYNNRGQVRQITLGAPASPTAQDSFWYDPAGDRFLKHATWDDNGSVEETWTLYLLGGSFEALHPVSNPDITVRQQVQVTQTVVYKRTVTPTGTTNAIEYQHRDHLGSISVITDAGGAVISNLAYDPFGARRENDWSADIGPTALEQVMAAANTTARGYTDHEHLDRTRFIHMNGRVYDPRIGRFLQADPMVQNPAFSQNYNRYSYVYNNPLSYTDPSGFIPEGSEVIDDSRGTDGFTPEDIETLERLLNESRGDLWLLSRTRRSWSITYDQLFWSFYTGCCIQEMMRMRAAEAPYIGDVLGGVEAYLAQIQTSDRSTGTRTTGSAAHEGVTNPREVVSGLVDAGGLFSSAALLRFISSDGQYWRGKNFKWNKIGWGGNQWTGKRSEFFRRAARVKGGAQTLFVLGAGLSVLDGYDAVARRDSIGVVTAGSDLGWGAAASFGGSIGLVGGLSYFGTSALIEIPAVRELTIQPLTYGLCTTSANCDEAMLR